MKVAYFDCSAGASGDMVLGALVDAGAPAGAITRALKPLCLPPWKMMVSRVKRGPFAALHVEVIRSGPPKRVIGRLLSRRRVRGMPSGVWERGVHILKGLLRAEAKVHGSPAGRIHLHEVDDLDTVVDVFGSVLALRMLGIERVWCSAFAAGSGSIRGAHGVMPVPAPGTAELMRGSRVQLGTRGMECTTPTGAAILGTLAEGGPPPVLRLERVGCGAGARETRDRPNILRVFTGTADSVSPAADVCELKAMVDDMNPQLLEAFLDRAYREGALEAWVAPVHTKRQRIGVELTALVHPERVRDVTKAFHEETTTLGVRIAMLPRAILQRSVKPLVTKWGRVRMKLAGAGASWHAVPEYRDMKRIADRTGVPLRLVMEEIRARAALAMGVKRGKRLM